MPSKQELTEREKRMADEIYLAVHRDVNKITGNYFEYLRIATKANTKANWLILCNIALTVAVVVLALVK